MGAQQRKHSADTIFLPFASLREIFQRERLSGLGSVLTMALQINFRIEGDISVRADCHSHSPLTVSESTTKLLFMAEDCIARVRNFASRDFCASDLNNLINFCCDNLGSIGFRSPNLTIAIYGFHCGLEIVNISI